MTVVSDGTEDLDELANFLQLRMREVFHRDGVVHTALLGYNHELEPVLTIVQGSLEDSHIAEVSERDNLIYVVPAPLKDYSDGIRKIAEKYEATTFAMMSENWTYPDGDAGVAAALAFMSGEGPPPSEHPDRKELVTVFVACPLRGYTRLIGWDIRRKNRSAPRLRPKFDSSAPQQDSIDPSLSFASSWLEECLPQPDTRS